MPINSGVFWVTWANSNAKDSDKIEDLEAPFKEKAAAFIKALEDAGAVVTISATKRSARSAYLFHWAWKISLGQCKPTDPGVMSGVDIRWDHGDDAKSKAAAREMVQGFGLVVPPASTNPPSLTSKHISGEAIDMNIVWAGVIKVKKKDGTEQQVVFANNANLNTNLHIVGASYGVKKLKTDAPHWSSDGH